MPRTEIEESDYQNERRIDVLLKELRRELQVRQTDLFTQIDTLRYTRDCVPNPDYKTLALVILLAITYVSEIPSSLRHRDSSGLRPE